TGLFGCAACAPVTYETLATAAAAMKAAAPVAGRFTDEKGTPTSVERTHKLRDPTPFLGPRASRPLFSSKTRAGRPRSQEGRGIGRNIYLNTRGGPESLIFDRAFSAA